MDTPEDGEDNIVEGAFGADHNQTDEMTLARACEAAVEEIEKIEVEQAKIDQINEKAKAKAASHRDSIKSLKKKIRDEYSIGAKPLGAILTKRKQERRMAERIESLEGTDADQFEQMELQFSKAA